VIGYSLGAMIAGRLATMHPERLMRVAYVASLPVRDSDTHIEKFAQESVKELEKRSPVSLVDAGPATAWFEAAHG
jgi:pimeloyl-ACP methyl ester carboxylesterase